MYPVILASESSICLRFTTRAPPPLPSLNVVFFDILVQKFVPMTIQLELCSDDMSGWKDMQSQIER